MCRLKIVLKITLFIFGGDGRGILETNFELNFVELEKNYKYIKTGLNCMELQEKKILWSFRFKEKG